MVAPRLELILASAAHTLSQARGRRAEVDVRSRLIIVTALLALAGCNAVKLVYNNADTIIADQIDRYFDLDREQSKRAERLTDDYLAWHRRVMLPRYAAWLRELAADSETGQGRERYAATVKAAMQLYEDTVLGALPRVAPVLAEQSPEQISFLEKRLKDRHDELAEKQARPRDEQRAEGLDMTYSVLEFFVGDLRDDQATMIASRLQPMFDRPSSWLDNRARKNAALVTFLRKRPTERETAQFLAGWVLRPWEYSPPEHRLEFDRNREVIELMLFDLSQSLDATQRRYFVRTLRQLAESCTELSS
jgi:hypothetical protein